MRTSNRTIGITLAAVIVGMVGVSFASVPLYRVFCAATGYGGTPQIGAAAAPGRDAPAHHRPLQCQHQPEPAVGLPPGAGSRSRLPLGEEQLAFYTARNQASTPVTGVALYNVTPDTAGKYFHKTACFCFNQQTLAPASRCSSR